MAKKSTTSETRKKDGSSQRGRSDRKKRVRVSYEAPNADAVSVTGSFCGWDEGVRLTRDGSGPWKATLTLPAGEHEYRFIVDGEWRDDPNCDERVPNRLGGENCVLHV